MNPQMVSPNNVANKILTPTKIGHVSYCPPTKNVSIAYLFNNGIATSKTAMNAA